MPLAIGVNFAVTGMDEHLMLPSVGVLRGMASGGKIKDSHTKIRGAVLFADKHPGRDAFDFGLVEIGGRDVSVLFDSHAIPFAAGT